MAKLQLKQGTASKRLRILLQDTSSTTGGLLTGIAFNSAGLTWKYIREDQGTFTTVSIVTASANSFTSGGFVEIGNGLYEIGIPNAALSAGTSVQHLLYGATNMLPVAIEIELTQTDNQDGVRNGCSALPNANAGASGGLLSLGTGTGQINASSGKVPATLASTDVSGNVAADLQTIKTQTVTAAAGVTFPSSIGTSTFASGGSVNATQWGSVNVTGMPMPTYTQPTGFLAATFPTTVSSFAGGAVASVTGAVGSVTSGVTVTTNNDKSGYSLSQSFPTNFSSLAITVGGAVTAGAVTLAASQPNYAPSKAGDKMDIADVPSSTGVAAFGVGLWSSVTRTLTAGTNIALAKGTGLTGLNDIAATAIVSGGAITTASGKVSNVGLVDTTTTLTNLPAAPTDWLTAASVKADAVTKIQSGLSTPSTPQTITPADSAASSTANSSIAALVTTIGVAGAGLTAVQYNGPASVASQSSVTNGFTNVLNAVAALPTTAQIVTGILTNATAGNFTTVGSLGSLFTGVGTSGMKLTTVALSNAPSGGGSGGLTGPSSVTLTFVDDAVPPNAVPFVEFSVNGSSPTRANENGQAVFGSNDGTFTVTAKTTNGIVFSNLAALLVNGTTTKTYSGSGIVLPSPASPEEITCFAYIRDGQGNPIAATYRFAMSALPADANSAMESFLKTPFDVTSDNTGLLAGSFRKGAKYRITRPSGAYSGAFTVPTSGASFAIPSTLL